MQTMTLFIHELHVDLELRTRKFTSRSRSTSRDSLEVSRRPRPRRYRYDLFEVSAVSVSSSLPFARPLDRTRPHVHTSTRTQAYFSVTGRPVVSSWYCHQRRGLLLSMKLLVLALLHLIALVAVASSDGAAETTAVSESDCHSYGFDPSSLSCDTCGLLVGTPLAQFEAECLQCCQKWKPDPVVNPDAGTSGFVGRYKLAVLRYDPESLGSYEEVQNFLNEDKKDVTKAKGTKAFVLEKVENDNQFNMGGFAALFGGMRIAPPTIHFYKTSTKSGEPDEEVSLRGFKREDIADMLMTMLPSS